MSSSIGPSLPPGFAARQSSEEEEEEEEEEDNEERATIGPPLPSISQNADSAKVVGPCMPPPPRSRATPTDASHVYGPSLPPGLVSKEEEEPDSTATESGDSDEDEEEDEVIGPMPSAPRSKVRDTIYNSLHPLPPLHHHSLHQLPPSPLPLSIYEG